MADLDTRQKRGSGVQVAQAYVIELPEPTLVVGDINAGDRQHLALCYAGISAGAASAFVPRLPLLGAG